MNGERAGSSIAGGDGLRRTRADRSSDRNRIRSDRQFCVRRRGRRVRAGADSANASSELKAHSNEAEHEHEERASVRTWKIQPDFPYLVDFNFDPSRPRVSRLTKQKRNRMRMLRGTGKRILLVPRTVCGHVKDSNGTRAVEKLLVFWSDMSDCE